VIHDGIPYDPIQGQGQGHIGLKVVKMAGFKVYLLHWSTFKQDLVDRGVYWNSVLAVATNRSRWRTLVAHCPVKDRRI